MLRRHNLKMLSHNEIRYAQQGRIYVSATKARISKQSEACRPWYLPPEDDLFDRICSRLSFSDLLDLLRRQVGEAPARFIDRNAKWPFMPFKVLCCIVGDVADVSIAQDVPQA